MGKSIRTRARIRWTIGFLLLTVSPVWLLGGVTIRLNPQSPISELKNARATWAKHNPSYYVMTMDFASFSYVGTYQIRVWNNTVTSVTELKFNQDTSAGTGIRDFPSNWQSAFSAFLPPDASHFTMDQIFVFVEKRIASQPVPPVIAWCGAPYSDGVARPHYEVSYDAQQGYITSLTYTNCIRYDWGAGLLCPSMSDCSTSFRVRSLQPIM